MKSSKSNNLLHGIRQHLRMLSCFRSTFGERISIIMCLVIPGQVMEISNEDPLLVMGQVNFGGLLRKVSLTFVPEVMVGDYVYVHAGVALSIIDEREANEVTAYISTIAETGQFENDYS